MATLLSAFHVFSSWKKVHHYWREGPLRNALAVLITFNAVCFGLLIFSGRIGAPPVVQQPPEKASTVKPSSPDL
jgi:hypothetical protein